VAGLSSKTDAVRKQYHFWPGEQRHDAWELDRLVRMSAGFPVTQIALDSIEEVDSVYWFNDELAPTIRRSMPCDSRLTPSRTTATAGPKLP
jgi:hypothetical protein